MNWRYTLIRRTLARRLLAAGEGPKSAWLASRMSRDRNKREGHFFALVESLETASGIPR